MLNTIRQFCLFSAIFKGLCIKFHGIACHSTTTYLWEKKQCIFIWNWNLQCLTLHLWNIVLSACEWCYYFLQMHEIFFKVKIGKFYYYLWLVKEWTSLNWFCLSIWQVILTTNLKLSVYKLLYKFISFKSSLDKQ